MMSVSLSKVTDGVKSWRGCANGKFHSHLQKWYKLEKFKNKVHWIFIVLSDERVLFNLKFKIMNFLSFHNMEDADSWYSRLVN